MTLSIVPLSSISIPPSRQREIFGEQELQELKDSILSEKGLMCPILVRPKDDGTGGYWLVAGERRFRTISTIEQSYGFGEQLVPLGHIPVVVKQFSSNIEAREAELHENIVRVNLSWQEKAKAIADLHELKTLQDPRQTPNMTAALIDQSPTTENTGYATNTAIKMVQNSLLVNAYMDDPEVKKAASLKDATKIVTRKLEQESLLRMREYAAQKEAARREQEQAQKDSPDAPSLDDLDEFNLSALPALNPKSNSQLLEGDIRERINDVHDGSINVVITDPPYGVGVAGFGDSGASALAHQYSEDDYDELHRVLVGHLSRVCSSSAHVYIFCDLDYFPVLRRMVGALEGWRVRRRPLIWWKGSTGNLTDGSGQGYKSTYECILYASRGSRPCSQVIPDVLQFPMVKHKIHAAQKPPELYKRLLEMSAVPGDTVLDAFAGSGTIFRAAQSFAVDAIGIEKEELFCEMCKLAIDGKEPDWEPEL